MQRPRSRKGFSLDVFTREPHDEYHARRSKYLSSHQLIDFHRCPLLLRKKQLKLIEPADSSQFAFGRAAHTLILECDEAFDREYMVSDGPINPKTGNAYGTTTKAWTEWARQQTKEIVTHDEHNTMQCMRRSVREHSEAAELLSDGAAELVLRADYRGCPSQMRADWICSGGILVDLKTCRDLDRIERDFSTYSYHHQLSFYRKLIEIQTGERLPVFMVAVEKQEPFRCGVWRIGEGVLGKAEQENDAAVDRYRECQERNEWPTGYEGVRELNYV